MNNEDPSLAQFLGAMRVDMRRNPELRKALEGIRSQRDAFFDRIVDFGVETGEIDPSKRDEVSALVLVLLIGLTDAVSGTPTRHRLAVDAIKDILEGKLLNPTTG